MYFMRKLNAILLIDDVQKLKLLLC
jgi:hypothetical protein